MAISNLGGRGRWSELGTSSPTSGTVVTFSSLPQHSEYKIAYFDIDTSSTSVRFDLTINNDTGSNYAFASLIDGSGSTWSSGVDTKIILGEGNGFVNNNHSGVVTINDANELIKQITYWHALGTNGVDVNNGQGFWNSQSVINRFDITLATGSFNSGTFKVYGRN